MKGQTEKKLLILYTELAGYLVSCVNLMAQKGVEIHIVRYPVNKEAPFQFQFEQNIHLHEINDHRGKLEGLSKSIQPDAILCSGWVEAEYLAVCASHRPKIPNIL